MLALALAACAADPMAGFARMASGEWTRPALTRANMSDVWHWGPGRQSIRAMTAGTAAGNEPWREVQVFFRHPGRQRVRLLTLNPFARSVGEGTVTFERDALEGVYDLYQTGGVRKMGLRWTFDGPDTYHAVLLEATGPAGLKPLAEWDYVRSKTPAGSRPVADKGVPKPPKHLKALEPLFGRSWEAKGEWAGKDAFHTRTSVEWVPYAEAVYVRVVAPGKDGEHLLDAYVYHHTGAGVLRCLALSDRGGVHEGDVTVLGGGAVRLDLTGHAGDRVVRHVVRFDPETDGTLRQRVWSVAGTGRSLMLDVRHKSPPPKKD